MRRLLALAGVVGAVLAASGCGGSPQPCASTVSSLAAAQSAVASASPGATICLSDGSYGKAVLTANKAKPGVMLQAEHPGQATLAGAELGGSNMILSRFRLTGQVTIDPGSKGATVFQDLIDLNAYQGFGVLACPSDTVTCDDMTIAGNRFVGQPEEDQIRANRYHAVSNPYGLLVIGNEFSGNQEIGDHNDVFQAVWGGDHLGFIANYLHDFGGQGFFVKDQDAPISGINASDNLIVDQDLPCNPASLCSGFQLSPFQVFGPATGVSMTHNTVGFGAGGGVGVLTGSLTGDFSNNVFRTLAVTNSGGSGTNVTGSGNSRCSGNGWPAPPGTSTLCSPAFLNPAAGDYRLADGRGVDWVPSSQHYGP